LILKNDIDFINFYLTDCSIFDIIPLAMSDLSFGCLLHSPVYNDLKVH